MLLFCSNGILFADPKQSPSADSRIEQKPEPGDGSESKFDLRACFNMVVFLAAKGELKTFPDLGSVGFQNPSLYSKFRKAFNYAPLSVSNFVNSVDLPDPTVDEVFGRAKKAETNILRELRKLVRETTEDSPIGKAVRKALATIERSGAYREYQKLVEERPGIKHESFETQTHQDERTGKAYSYLQAMLMNMKGALTELDFAFRLPNLVDIQVKEKDLPPDFRKLFPEDPGLSSSDIDVIFKNGSAWAEVKSIELRVNSAMLRHLGLFTQVQLWAKIRDDLQKQGKQLELHFFFENGGITPSAAKELEAYGVIVHGIRYGEEKPLMYQRKPKRFIVNTSE